MRACLQFLGAAHRLQSAQSLEQVPANSGSILHEPLIPDDLERGQAGSSGGRASAKGVEVLHAVAEGARQGRGCHLA